MLIVLGIVFLGLLVAAILQGHYLAKQQPAMVIVREEEAESLVVDLGMFEFNLVFGWDQLWPHIWAGVGVYLVTGFWCWALWLYHWSWSRIIAEAPFWFIATILLATAIPPVLWLANLFARFPKLRPEVVIGMIALGAMLMTLPLWWPGIALWLPGYGLQRLWLRIYEKVSNAKAKSAARLRAIRYEQ